MRGIGWIGVTVALCCALIGLAGCMPPGPTPPGPVTLAEESGTVIPPSSPSARIYDIERRRPEEVMSAYLRARAEGRMHDAWNLIDPSERPVYLNWKHEVGPERVLSFRVGPSVLATDGAAQVPVAFEVRRRDRRVVEATETWSVVRRDGYWCVPLEPHP